MNQCRLCKNRAGEDGLCWICQQDKNLAETIVALYQAGDMEGMQEMAEYFCSELDRKCHDSLGVKKWNAS